MRFAGPEASLSLILALFASFFLRQVLCDLPVHCLRHQVEGAWEFTLSPLGPRRTSCGHIKPDSPQKQPHASFLATLGSSTSRRFTLTDPDVATAEDDGAIGTWTMIYDEGFEVAVGELVFFAFSKFTYKTDAKGGLQNVSHCDHTQVGWYHDVTRKNWGCYVGRKVGAEDIDEGVIPSDARSPGVDSVSTPVEPVDSDVSAGGAPSGQEDDPSAAGGDVQVSNSLLALADSSAESSFPHSDGFDRPMKSGWQQSIAEALNLLQLGWSAATYGMFQGKTPRQLNSFAGVRRNRPHRPQRNTSQPAAETHQASSFLSMSSKVQHIRSRSHRGRTPTAMDWRRERGRNWVPPVVSQGDCGSCYTIATVHMLTSRNRITHNDMSEPSFSVSFPLYCSEYNQGCDGGYGFLMSKWSEDVGLVPESCAPFSEGGGSCGVTDDCDLGAKRYRAVNHHYVGGYYGAANAEAMQRELVQRGPLVVSFEPKEDFMYYKTGVYRSGRNIHQEWEQVDHAVLLVGYGVGRKLDYWTLQNSWGTDWGERGYFRMARGIDESGCESIAVAADVTEGNENPVLDDLLSSL